MNNLILILGTCGVLAYVLTKVYDMVKSTRKLSEIFKNKDINKEKKRYREQIGEYERNIEKLQKEYEANTKKPVSHKQKKNNKMLTKMIEKNEKEKEKIDVASKQFENLARDWTLHSGEIPNAEIRKHLKEYLNNRKRL